MSDKISATDKTSKAKKKRLPKGQRKHVRRMKQEARKLA